MAVKYRVGVLDGGDIDWNSWITSSTIEVDVNGGVMTTPGLSEAIAAIEAWIGTNDSFNVHANSTGGEVAIGYAGLTVKDDNADGRRSRAGGMRWAPGTGNALEIEFFPVEPLDEESTYLTWETNPNLPPAGVKVIVRRW